MPFSSRYSIFNDEKKKKSVCYCLTGFVSDAESNEKLQAQYFTH